MMPVIAQFYSPSLELILLIIALTVDVALAVVVYRNNPKSATNIIFAFLTLFTMLWLADTYVVRLSELHDYALVLHRFGIFCAAPMSLLFFLLAHTFPSDTLQLSKKWFYASIGATLVMMILNASPFAFTSVVESAGSLRLVPGLGIAPFSIISTIFSVLAVYLLVKKYRMSVDGPKKQIKFILIGIVTMLALIITTLLVPIIVFNSAIFLQFTPLYTLTFLGMTAYAITKYQLFNIKVLLAQVLTLIIIVVLFARIFGETTTDARIIDGLLLVFVLVFGFFLVRSVHREVEQREKIEKLSEEKSEFMTFASHEIRNPITAMRGYASLITDGTTGDVPPKVMDAAQKILILGDEVLALISQFLNKSKIELGQVSYSITDFDVGAIVAVVADGYRPHAEQKGLELKKELSPSENLHIQADEAKVKEVIGNIIDNSLKYTPTGSITVSAHRHGVHVRVVVSDTGVGIPAETLPHLFKKFSRADAQRVNILGTGVGLYLAKTFIEAMGGRIWAESDGKDKGSRFIIEFTAV